MKESKIFYDLNALVDTYNIDNPYEEYKRYEFIQKINNYVSLKDSNILEFGPASGRMTAILAKVANKVVAVDGSSEFIKIAKEQVQHAENVTFHESYFENFTTDEKFDCLILHHILEHIEHPLQLLPQLGAYLNEEGIIVISVPNAHALSRQLAVKMGLMDSIYDLTENDRHHGHFRVYDWKTLEEQIVQAGYAIVGKHGLAFKLLSDKQNIKMMETNIIGEEQMKGLWLLADEYPEIAGAIMIVAKKLP